MAFDIPTYLSSLKAAHLKTLALKVGINVGGTKPVLTCRLFAHLRAPRLPLCDGQKILSIDMGIKNLAYCLLQVQPNVEDVAKVQDRNRIRVLAWKRISLPPPPPLDVNGTPLGDAKHGSTPIVKASKTFPPAFLASHAHDLLTETLLPLNPAIILIERQRFRSGNAPAVQEWTLSVNMFEMGLYSVLETLKKLHAQKRVASTVASFPEIRPVLPSRVAAYWAGGGGVGGGRISLGVDVDRGGLSGGKRGGSRGMEKKEKVELVRQWLSDDDGDNQDLEVQDEAITAAKAFLTQNQDKPARRGTTTTKKARKMNDVTLKSTLMRNDSTEGVYNVDEKPGKLDDLADCLLQGMAWIEWEKQRRALADGGEDVARGMLNMKDDDVGAARAAKKTGKVVREEKSRSRRGK